MKYKFYYTIVIPIILSALFGLSYLLTSSQDLFFQDAPRFISAAATLGVTKPPQPLSIILAHLFTLIPLGTIVSRVQLFSAFFAAAALFTLFKLTEKIIFLTHSPDVSVRAIHESPLLSSSFALFTLAAIPAFWTQAQNADGFTLVTFLFIVLLTLTVLPRNFHRHLSFSFLFGLSLGTIPVIVSSLPGLFLLWQENARILNLKRYLAILFFGLLGIILVFTYLPLSANSNPFLNWMRPTNLKGVWNLATGAGLNIYDPSSGRTNGFTFSPNVFLISAQVYFERIWSNITPFLLPFIILGAVYIWQKSARIFSVLFLAIFINLLLSCIYLSGNQESWYLISYAVLSVFSGLGFYRIATMIPFKKYRPFILLIFLIPLIILFFRRSSVDNRRWMITSDYINNLYQPLVPPAILYGTGDLFFSSSYLAHDIIFPDKEIIPVTSEIYRDKWYRENLRKTTGLSVPEPEPGQVNAVNFWRYLNQFFDKNLTKYKIYLTHRSLTDDFPIINAPPGTLPQISSKFKLVPSGLTLELVSKDTVRFPLPADFDYHFSNQEFPGVLPFLDVRSYALELVRLIHDYAYSYQSLADYSLQHNRKDLAINYYQKSYLMEKVQKTYTFDPNLEIIGRLGNFYAGENEYTLAEKYFQEGLSINPDIPEFILNIGILKTKMNQKEDARHYFNRVIALYPETDFARRAADLLSGL